MAKVLVSQKTNGYQMKEGDLLYSLVPCTSKSGQGFTNSSRSKLSSFLNGPDNYYSDLSFRRHCKINHKNTADVTLLSIFYYYLQENLLENRPAT